MSKELATKGATDPTNWRTPSFFYNSAREGMGDLLRAISSDDGQRILMPAFIGWSPLEGSGVFDPVRNSEWEADFYELEPDLSIRWSELERSLQSGLYRAVVVIHYFGRTEPALENIRRVADENNVILIEDLAHGLFSAQQPESRAGKQGDALIFSLHKMLPVPCGGMIVYRNAELVRGQLSTRVDLSATLTSYDLRSIAARRQSNYRSLEILLKQVDLYGVRFELIWPHFPDDDVPQSLPVRIIDGDRDAVYRQMNSTGFGMVSLYHTLIDELHGSKAMMDLAGQIINFPIHQDVDASVYDAMVHSFVTSLKQNTK